MNRQTATTVLLVLLILIMLGVLPLWPYSSAWGWYPTGGIGLLAAIIIAVLLLSKT